MTSHVYEFSQQDFWGRRGASMLDNHFRRDYQIRIATLSDDLKGIDRFFVDPITGESTTVEYKTDRRAHRTLRVFIETFSDVDRKKPGWATTAKAEWLAYFILFEERVFFVRLAELRRYLPDWQKNYQSRLSPNHGYHTKGIIVPISVFAKVCQHECQVPWKLHRSRTMPRQPVRLLSGRLRDFIPQ